MMESFTSASAIFPATIKVKQQKCFFQPRKRPRDMGVSAPKVSKGRSESPLVAPAGAKPLLAQKSSFGCKTSYSVAPIWRDNMQVVGRAAWGRVCGRAKLLAGTLRCLHLCWRLPWDWSDAEQLGRCPKPQQGRCPCTLQGTLSLDPFWRSGLSALPMLCPAGGFCPFLPFLIGTGT